MKKELLKYLIAIESLSVFGKLKEDPVIGCLYRLLRDLTAEEDDLDPVTLTEAYSALISTLYPVTSDLSEYIRKAVVTDDNFYIQAIACGDPISDEVRQAAEWELNNLEYIAGISCHMIKDAIAENETEPVSSLIKGMPQWVNSPLNLSEDFSKKVSDLSRTGYGMFAGHVFFRVSGEEIIPVPHPDAQSLSELFGYERQKAQIIKNTEALLGIKGDSKSSSASNMLLYGDAGTGKSSTVKAVAREYADRGLRLIEIKKDQLMQIPKVLETISRQPLKFILFIDDLSFTENDDNFSALKATLEGSVTGRGDNSVIYATSNRRHLIRESFSDRNGDDIHVNDTLQETMSLSARFGLTVIFERPDRDEYLDIVVNLARLNGINMAEDELINKAETHAIRRNGRSPRTARQFVELLKSGFYQ